MSEGLPTTVWGGWAWKVAERVSVAKSRGNLMGCQFVQCCSTVFARWSKLLIYARRAILVARGVE